METESPQSTSTNGSSCISSSHNNNNNNYRNGPPIPTSTELKSLSTTFIHADSTSFKHVVQMLTGSAGAQPNGTPPLPPPPASASKVPTGPKKPAFKLHERRGGLKSIKTARPMIPTRKQLTEISPVSVLDFPSLVLSPALSAEERAIAEKSFYLHPSPRDAEPPRLLPLFPLSSPREYRLLD